MSTISADRCRLARRVSTVVATLLLASALPAQTYRLTFDADDPIGGLAPGSWLADQYAMFGATFSAPFFTGNESPNGNWSAGVDRTVVSFAGGDVGALGGPSLVSGNGVRRVEGWLLEDGDPSMRLTFGFGVSDFSIDFAGIGLGDEGTNTGFIAFNGAAEIGRVFATRGAAVSQQRLRFTAPTNQRMTHVALLPGTLTDWVAFDNVTYTRAPATTVPEPGTFGLLVAGVVGVVVAQKRRRGIGEVFLPHC
jgi:hypothetical protein